MRVTPEVLLARIGQMIVRWNALETAMSNLLLTLCRDRTASSRILTANMGSVALMESLETISNEGSLQELRPHVEHARKMFELLREYRNYYVHSIREVALTGTTAAAYSWDELEYRLWVSEISSKRRLHQRYSFLTEAVLVDFLHITWQAQVYVATLDSFAWWSFDGRQRPRRELPVMPHLPRPLVKDRINLLDKEANG